jgi:hypothetical protein
MAHGSGGKRAALPISWLRGMTTKGFAEDLPFDPIGPRGGKRVMIARWDLHYIIARVCCLLDG